MNAEQVSFVLLLYLMLLFTPTASIQIPFASETKWAYTHLVEQDGE